MTAHRMAAVDARVLLDVGQSPQRRFPCSTHSTANPPISSRHREVCRRARACPDLTMRVHDGSPLTYPQWVPAAVEPEQVVCHDLADDSWDGCLAAVVGLADDQLDMRRMPWRLHVFTPVFGIPGVDGPGTVVVCRSRMRWPTAFALRRWRPGCSAGRPRCPRCSRHRRAFCPGGPSTRPARIAGWFATPARGCWRPGSGYRPPLPTNARPAGARSLRTLVRHRSQLPGPTVTVAVLAAVSAALSVCSAMRPIRWAPKCRWLNPVCHMHITISEMSSSGCTPSLTGMPACERIAADLANGRRRFEHPATRAADRAFAAVPAPLLRWGVGRSTPTPGPRRCWATPWCPAFNRGSRRSEFRGRPVVLTATYPRAVAGDGSDARGARHRRDDRDQCQRGRVGDRRHRRLSGPSGRRAVETYWRHRIWPLLAGQADGDDQFLVQFEPHGVVGVDERPGQPGGFAGFDFAQCRAISTNRRSAAAVVPRPRR